MATGWEAYQFLLGEWEGGNEADPRQGHGRFSFRFDLDQNILVRKNRTVFPETADRAAYTHDDLLIIYNQNSSATRAIYFDNEEHVIHYDVTMKKKKKMITLVSDPAPATPRFRFTYTHTSPETLDARFEIAPPGATGCFTVYLEGSSRRLKSK